MERRCENCEFYHEVEAIYGDCRHHAPTADDWPPVFGSDWCGQFKARVGQGENPITDDTKQGAG